MTELVVGLANLQCAAGLWVRDCAALVLSIGGLGCLCAAVRLVRRLPPIGLSPDEEPPDRGGTVAPRQPVF